MNIFRPSTVVFVLASLVFLVNTSSAQTLSMKETPAPVQAAFKKSFPKATIKAVTKESAEGKDFYKIESVDGKTQRNIYYSPAGETVETEESIEPANLPPAIKQYLTKKYPKGYIIAGVYVKTKDIAGYQLDIQNGKKKLSLSFDAAGKLLK
jgi:hypothetical protein